MTTPTVPFVPRRLARVATDALRLATTYLLGEPIVGMDPAAPQNVGRLFMGDGVTAGGLPHAFLSELTAETARAEAAEAAIAASVLASSPAKLAAGNFVQGRLTLQSGAPVLSAGVAGATSILYTPYTGNLVPIWNGTSFGQMVFSEYAQALSDTTYSPLAAAANNVYDVFAWVDTTVVPNVVRFTRGPTWSSGATPGSNTVRGSGAGSSALIRQSGLLVNQYAITNGPAAGYGTYMGTFATDLSAATVSVAFGGISTGGTAAVIGLWNAFNRVEVGGTIGDSTASWTYSAGLLRQANGSTAMRVTFVTGQPDDPWTAEYCAIMQPSASAYALASVGLDTTSTATTPTCLGGFAPGGAGVATVTAKLKARGLLGVHFLAALEYTYSGTMTGYGTTSNTQSGLVWSGRY